MDHTGMTGVPAGTSPASGGSSRPEHGTWEGHILPGSFFVVWSIWWLYSNFRLYLRSSAKRPYKSRSWYEFPWTGSRYPLEPILKMLLPFIGANAELWAGHVSYRRLYDPQTGHFEQGNIQDWQHAAMYTAFIISGAVDLIGFYSPSGSLPQGIEHGFLGISLLIEGILFGFHLKGTALDMRLHLILVLVIFACSCICFLEMQHPHSFVLGTTRSLLMLLQGLWFYQIAAILFTENPAWDPNTHAALMMVPFFFVMWIMVVSFGSLLLFAGISVYLRKPSHYELIGHTEGSWAPINGHHQQLSTEVEMNGAHRQ